MSQALIVAIKLVFIKWALWLTTEKKRRSLLEGTRCGAGNGRGGSTADIKLSKKKTHNLSLKKSIVTKKKKKI
jgi:hypothetical protein